MKTVAEMTEAPSGWTMQLLPLAVSHHDQPSGHPFSCLLGTESFVVSKALAIFYFFWVSQENTHSDVYQDSSSVSSGFSYGDPLRNSHRVARSPRTPEREVRWKVSMDLSPVYLRMSPSRRVGQHSEKCFGLPESGPDVFR